MLARTGFIDATLFRNTLAKTTGWSPLPGTSGRSYPVRALKYTDPGSSPGKLLIAARRHNGLDAPQVVGGQADRMRHAA